MGNPSLKSLEAAGIRSGWTPACRKLAAWLSLIKPKGDRVSPFSFLHDEAVKLLTLYQLSIWNRKSILFKPTIVGDAKQKSQYCNFICNPAARWIVLKVQKANEAKSFHGEFTHAFICSFIHSSMHSLNISSRCIFELGEWGYVIIPRSSWGNQSGCMWLCVSSSTLGSGVLLLFSLGTNHFSCSLGGNLKLSYTVEERSSSPTSSSVWDPLPSLQKAIPWADPNSDGGYSSVETS